MIVGEISEALLSGAPDGRSLNPSAYHITHEGNLAALFATGFLYSDSQMRSMGAQHIVIGYAHTKNNRLDTVIPQCSDLTTGDCVPFYLCPRSVMLCVIWYANSPQLATRYGQKPVVHLRFNLRKVYEWAKANCLRTFVTNANAAAAQAEIFDDIRALALLDWDSIESRDWRDGAVKSMKESEFLVENRVPLELLEEIGVIDESHQKVVNDIVSGHSGLRHVLVNIRRDWYYG